MPPPSPPPSIVPLVGGVALHSLWHRGPPTTTTYPTTKRVALQRRLVGKGSRPDLPGASGLERLGCCPERGAGGCDVVNQEHSPGEGRAAPAERIADIALPLVAAKPGLVLG